MTKQKVLWACTECGATQSKWSGQCPTCKEWNTLSEEVEMPKAPARFQSATSSGAKAVQIADIDPGECKRAVTGIGEFDRLLGGGLVKGSLSLVGGEPGIGKSTLMLQLSSALAKQGLIVLYVCGEESVDQTALRAKRLGVDSKNLYLLSEIQFSRVKHQIDAVKPDVLIVDSVQILYKEEIPSSPGSVTQVREIATECMQLAKGRGISTFLIGHVTKSGEIAGPRVLSHLVDTVLEFEGDREHGYRVLRATKNRFGPTDDVALFQMDSGGLSEVPNPSEVFLKERMREVTGSAITPTIEGSRSILIETQALVASSAYSTPSRKSTGIDSNRLSLLLAVMEKRLGYALYQSDVFVSVTGGLRITEPALDLGVLTSIASSFANRPIDFEVAVMGEVGLSGEVRSIPRVEARVKEAINLGFKRLVMPSRNLKGLPKALTSKIELIGVDHVTEAVKALIT